MSKTIEIKNGNTEDAYKEIAEASTLNNTPRESMVEDFIVENQWSTRVSPRLVPETNLEKLTRQVEINMKETCRLNLIEAAYNRGFLQPDARNEEEWINDVFKTI